MCKTYVLIFLHIANDESSHSVCPSITIVTPNLFFTILCRTWWPRQGGEGSLPPSPEIKGGRWERKTVGRGFLIDKYGDAVVYCSKVISDTYARCVDISINQHQSVFISVNQHQSISASININRHQSAPASTSINQNKSVTTSISTNKYQYASIYINQYQSEFINTHQSASISINQCQSASNSISINQN